MTSSPLLEQSARSHRFRPPALLRELITLHAAPPRYRSAFIAALCTAVPIVWGQAAGQPTLGLIASTGALAALYGGRGTVRQEASAVGAAAVSLTLSIAIGSALAGHRWYAVLGTALWAAVATAGSALIHARPPTTVMPVLLCAVGSGLPPGHSAPRIVVVAITALGATLLSSLAALGRRQFPGSPPPPSLSSRHWRVALTQLPSSPVPLMACRAGLAVALAGAAALICHTGRPYWAMATAGAVLASGSYAASANRRALLRGTGTAAGCLLAAALAATHPQGLTIAAFLGALTLIIELVVARNYALAMIFVTPLSTLLVASATHTTAVFTITLDRLLETVLGCLAAITAGQLVTRRWALHQRQQAVAALLLAAADLLEDPVRPDGLPNLQSARQQLLLVSERTAGERPAVRTAAATLDHIADAAHHASEHTQHLHHPAGSANSSQARELRRIAALLAPKAIDGTTQDPAARLADLESSLKRWNENILRQPTGDPITNRSDA